MELVHSNHDLKDRVRAARAQGKRIGFVPTMGALHAGHLSLVEIAKVATDFVVVSVFVNPKQFGEGEDFDKYPRTLGVDARLLADAGVDLLYAPSVSEVYPADKEIPQLKAGAIGAEFEGASRPGHFDGMLTVVSRLFDLVQPDIAVFGQKDAQQVALVKNMLREQISSGMRAPVDLVVGPTMRQESGLALSSRNRFLKEKEIPAALSLSQALRAGQGGNTREQVLQLALAEISPEAKLEYLEIVDADSFEKTDPSNPSALLIVAATVGEVRLIDNVFIDRKM